MRRWGSTIAGLTLLLSVGACGVTSSTVLDVGQPAPPPVPGQAPDAPILPVAPICIGLPLQQCLETARSAAQGLNQGGGRELAEVARITVRCLKVCTQRDGEGETRIDFLDGSTEVSGWGYATADG